MCVWGHAYRCENVCVCVCVCVCVSVYLISPPPQVHMPDLEMIVNLGDWPLNKNRPNHPLLPVFSWCGSPDTRDIIWPTWDMMKATIMALDRWVQLLIIKISY